MWQPPGTCNLASRRSMGIGGFTLLEMIVVIAIIAIMGATAISSMSNLSSSRQRAASTQVLHDLQFARERAVSLGTTTWVVFDVSQDTLWLHIEDVDNPGRANRSLMPDPSGVGDYEVVLNQGAFKDAGIVQVSIPGATEIGFNSLGQPLTSDEAILATDAFIELVGSHILMIEGTTGYIHLVP